MIEHFDHSISFIFSTAKSIWNPAPDAACRLKFQKEACIVFGEACAGLLVIPGDSW